MPCDVLCSFTLKEIEEPQPSLASNAEPIPVRNQRLLSIFFVYTPNLDPLGTTAILSRIWVLARAAEIVGDRAVSPPNIDVGPVSDEDLARELPILALPLAVLTAAGPLERAVTASNHCQAHWGQPCPTTKKGDSGSKLTARNGGDNRRRSRNREGIIIAPLRILVHIIIFLYIHL